MPEVTDAKVLFIRYTPEMEGARSRGEMKLNSFVRLRRLSGGASPTVEVNDLDGADRLLSNPHLLDEAARQFLKCRVVPAEDGWGGWLGN